MTKRNKKYRPKQVFIDPISWAISGATLLTQNQKDDLFGMVRVELHNLSLGKLDRDGWNTLANAMNIAEALASFNIANNLMSEITRAQDALKSLALRMLKTGSSTCYAKEIGDIHEGCNIHKIQLDFCTQAELSRAVAKVKEQHRNGTMQEMKKIFESL